MRGLKRKRLIYRVQVYVWSIMLPVSVTWHALGQSVTYVSFLSVFALVATFAGDASATSAEIAAFEAELAARNEPDLEN